MSYSKVGACAGLMPSLGHQLTLRADLAIH
jgi:hypothetical protein